jgi:hypothetical protein
MNALEVNDDDIIHLNVCGQRLSTTRATLSQVEGSFLASMFSGRWEGAHKRDDDGAVFLDYNPEFFVPILNCLRAMKYATPGNPPSFPQFNTRRSNERFQTFYPVPRVERRNLPP